MSASTEKKNRQAVRQSGIDKKATAAAEEAAKRKKANRITAIVVAAVAVVLVLSLLITSTFFWTHGSALSIGSRNYTPAELNYAYASQFYTFANQYSGYLSLFGLQNATISQLDSVQCGISDIGTWRDYFVDLAAQELQQTQALLDYAAANGITLSEEEIAQIDADLADTETSVKAVGYPSLDNYFDTAYGTGVTAKLVRQASIDAQLADKAYDHMLDSLSFTDEELEEYYQGLNGSYDVFDYAYYTVNAETVESGEGENVTSAVTDETMAAAKKTADDIVSAFKSGDEKDADALNEAVASVVDGAAAVTRSGVAGSSLGSYSEFLMDDSRKSGDVTVIENEGSGYTVVLFLNRDDNHYNTRSVRHILISAEAGEDGTYSDEANLAAQLRANEILNEWKAGEATEESFAALAEQYSTDTGSNTNGGLYENVARGSMVEEFDAFLFDESRKSGDTGVVYGNNGNYSGYHVMYYVGEGQQYSDYIAENLMKSERMSAWLEELSSALTATRHNTLVWKW